MAWAIKQAEVNAGFGRAWHYKDVCHAYRAGHAARDAEVETLRLALVACGKLLAEQALVEALNDATAALKGRTND
jgi:hypothetical protein